MGARRQAREAALQILYWIDVGGLEPRAAVDVYFLGVTDLPERSKIFAEQLALGCAQQRKELDALITKYAENWEIGRMAAVDRNILRLASHELLSHLETPISVVIDEAVEIAKLYSTEESGKFVNGILDKIKLERP